LYEVVKNSKFRCATLISILPIVKNKRECQRESSGELMNDIHAKMHSLILNNFV